MKPVSFERYRNDLSGVVVDGVVARAAGVANFGDHTGEAMTIAAVPLEASDDPVLFSKPSTARYVTDEPIFRYSMPPIDRPAPVGASAAC